jgi:nitroreductase
MNVINAIKNRRSIRNYLARPVEPEKLAKVLEAARLAPSANNQQNWKFVVVMDKDMIGKIADIAGKQEFIKQAPVILAACGTDPMMMTCGEYRRSVDLSIATAFMTLEAVEQGLGTCIIARFDQDKMKALLGIPEPVKIILLTILGYPNEKPEPKPRKAITDIVCYGKYKA